ncbi:MAG: hypothetical protein ABH854_01750 [Candidatus Diapherotrites archaeon]
MYPEEGGGGEPAGGGGLPKIGYNLEGLIPVVLIVVIGFFVAVFFGVITSNTPLVGPIANLLTGGGQPAQMLIIGATSQEVIDVLDDSRDLVRYVVKTPETMERNPDQQLGYYDIVMIDQSEQSNKSVSRELGQAIESYVKKGGKLIVVKDSGTTRPGTPDVAGWMNTFGKGLVPVECDRQINDQPTCQSKIYVRGKVFAEDEKHPIMRGIPVAPVDPNMFIDFDVFDVTPVGKEIAYIQEASTKKTYTAIVEKTGLIGKSIYFNYNPGKTRGIFESTLRYLK